MAEFPGIEEMANKVAETALDGFEYQGKTIREWVKTIVEQGWIPTSSGKLPENNEEVWITDVEGKVERARFYKEPHPEDGEKDMFACRTYLVYAENVLAWQPILKPEPYKEGEKDETDN